MKRISFIVVAMLTVLIAGTVLAWHLGLFIRDRRPNVVLVIIDTLRADRLSCYGFDLQTSSELDAYARQGVRFANTISQSPWTRPSIGSFLTSLHPRTIGIHFEKEGILNDNYVTLAEVLQENGYRTFGATANPHLNPSFNFHQGFDFYRSSVSVFEWMDDQHGQVPAAHPTLPSAKKLFTEILTTLEREKRRHRRKPYYLQFNIMEVHETYGSNNLVSSRFRRMYQEIRGRERRYLQAIRQVSFDIDWFIKTLTARSGWENTLFVLISDHGEGLNSHPHVAGSGFHGLLLYESQLKVPWIMYSTDGSLPTDLVIEQPVRLLDLMPTLLDHLNIPPLTGMAGVSLKPLLQKHSVAGLPDRFVVETHFRFTNKMGVYTDKWKYFENRGRHIGLDPKVLHPVGVTEDGPKTDVSEQYPVILQQLEAYLKQWESEHPSTPSTMGSVGFSEEELKQLKSLGYLDGSH